MSFTEIVVQMAVAFARSVPGGKCAPQGDIIASPGDDES